jgi:hypothetical protein
MEGLFPSWSDTALRFFLGGVLALIVSVFVGLMIYVRTPYNLQEQYLVEQPVQFDHRHHVRDDGIECLYCHNLAEHSSSAGIPPTELCMGCHSQIWGHSTKLDLVRRSFFENTPIPWRRVHDLPDFVYFNHSVHVNAGVQCIHCHGDVANMPVVHKTQPFTMGFCLDCHRHPDVFVPGYRADTGFAGEGKLEANVSIVTNKLMTCTACHR